MQYKDVYNMEIIEKYGFYTNYYRQKNIKDRLDKYCEKVGQTNTMAIKRIVKQFLDEHDKKTQLEES